MDLLWPHKVDAANCPLPGSPDILGKKISAWNLIATETGGSQAGAIFSTNRSNYGVVVHEYLHILGLPDLYRSTESGAPVGYYDIMASTIGSYPQGIMAVMASDYGDLKWHNPRKEITQSTEVTLQKPQYTNPDEENAVKIFSPYSSNEYFVAEYYERNPVEKQLASSNTTSYSDSDGLLLSRMKTDAYTNIDKEAGEDMLYVFRPGEAAANQGKGNMKQAVLNMENKETKRTTFGTASGNGFDSQSLCLSDGSNSGIVVELTGQTKDTITFKVTIPDVSGAGTPDDPYLISSPDDLNMIGSRPDAYYRLTKDIDFEGVDFTSLEAIGGFSAPGELDGNGKTIKNLTIQNGTGLFKIIESTGTVKNLNFENLHIAGTDVQVGGLAGNIQGKVENVCILSGQIENSAADKDFPYNTICAGGLAGYMGDLASITNCQVSASVSVSDNKAYAGGLAGHCANGFKIRNSFANSHITGFTKGGIIGLIDNFSGGPYNSELSNNYYDTVSTGVSESIGKCTNIKPPSEIGAYAVTAPQNIDLDLDTAKDSDLNITFFPASGTPSQPLEITFGSTAIADLSNNKITATGIGTTEMNTKIPVGTHFMLLKTTVNVTGKDIPDASCLTADLQNKVYNKTPQGVSVTAKDGITGLGVLTIKYKSGEAPATTDIPADAGTYTVLADITAGDGFQAGSDILLGTYTIEPLTLTGVKISVPNIAIDSAEQLTGQTLALTADNFIAGDMANAQNCTIDFPATTAAGTFSDASVTIGNLDNPNYQLSSRMLTNQTYIVEDRVLSSIHISQSPDKLEYIEGDTFSKAGMKVEALWDNHGVQEITDITDATVFSPSRSLTAADTAITLSYGGKTTDLVITVRPLTVESINITNAPEKTEYFEGENFTPAGMIVMANYNNGTQTEVTESCTFSPSSLTVSTKEITVTYNSVTAKQPVTVKQLLPESIEITTPPSKTTYIEGESFDISGIQVFLQNNNGTKTDISRDCTASKEPLKAGTTAIDIIYESSGFRFKASQSITVIEKPIVPQLESIKITQQPDKTQYFEGDIFEPAGMIIMAVFDDGTERDITAECRFSPSLMSTDTTKVIVTYYGTTAGQTVTVQKVTAEKLVIDTPPRKIVYTEGEIFDSTDIKISLVYNNGAREDVTKDCSIPADILNKNTREIKVTYDKDGITFDAVQNITVNKKPIQLNSLKITHKPDKMEYFEGETFDSAGMVVMAAYDDGNETDVTKYCTFSPSPLTSDTTEVTVAYDNHTTAQSVIVKKVVPEKIVIDAPPQYTVYTEGESFDSTGMKVFLVFNNKTKTDISQECSIPKEPLKPGTTDIEITYEKDGVVYKVTQDITVHKASLKLESIKITHKPNKTDYFEGDTFDSAGMTVMAIYDVGTKSEVTGSCSFSPSTLSADTTEITVTYKDKTAKQKVSVKKVQAEKIVIDTAPDKIVYTEGEHFDSTGMKVLLIYNNGTKEDVTKDCSISKEALKAGAAKIEITYKKDSNVYKVSQKVTVNKVPKYSEKELTDPDTGFMVSGSFTDKADLSVIKLKKSGDDYKTLAARIANMEILGFYEVSVTDDSYEGELTVNIPVDEGYNGKTITVKIIKSNGEIETIEQEAGNGYVTVTLGENSRIMIAVDKKTAATVKEKAKTPSSKSSAANSKKTAQANGAKTDDNTPIGALASMLLISAAGIIYIIRKRKVS